MHHAIQADLPKTPEGRVRALTWGLLQCWASYQQRTLLRRKQWPTLQLRTTKAQRTVTYTRTHSQCQGPSQMQAINPKSRLLTIRQPCPRQAPGWRKTESLTAVTGMGSVSAEQTVTAKTTGPGTALNTGEPVHSQPQPGGARTSLSPSRISLHRLIFAEFI